MLPRQKKSFHQNPCCQLLLLYNTCLSGFGSDQKTKCLGLFSFTGFDIHNMFRLTPWSHVISCTNDSDKVTQMTIFDKFKNIDHDKI